MKTFGLVLLIGGVIGLICAWGGLELPFLLGGSVIATAGGATITALAKGESAATKRGPNQFS